MDRPNELRLFISSTFRDLQEEREHLVKKIFPEIRALCRERGITFTEVDLRWGLTDEDVVLGQVIRTCLDEVDRCRPYFIGITGERYGYVPDLHEYYRDPELLVRWPWLEDAAMEGASVTDLEFRHGALNDPEGASTARFFFRRQRRSLDTVNSAEVQDGESTRLEGLRDRVRSAGLVTLEYRDPASLGEMIYDELIEIIERDFAGSRPLTPLEEERSRHEAFAASRRHAYIPNPDYLTRLNRWIDEEETPMILYAESGSGKSSLLSFWCESLRRRRPDLHIIEHYVGIGAGDADHLGMIRHVMEEMKVRFDRSEEIPSKPEELETRFSNWLGFNVSTSREGVREPVLLVIDGINQLSGRALDLHWLPPTMPEGNRLVISSTVEGTLVDLRSRGWIELGMQPLKEKEREAIIVRFLAEYHKALSPEQVRRIAEDIKCAHPLFLRTLLEELRLHGRHDHLDRTLETLLATTGTEDLFQRVLERMEEDYGPKVVRDVLGLMWSSRSGLDEEALVEITQISRLRLSTLLLGLDYHLVRRDGNLSFFHDYLRRAVEKRYVTDQQSRRRYSDEISGYCRERLSGLSSAETDSRRRLAAEMCYQYDTIGDRERLTAALTDISTFLLLYQGPSRDEVLRYWGSIGSETDIAGLYRRELDRPVPFENHSRREEGLEAISTLLFQLGRLPAAEEFARERLKLAIATGSVREASARTDLALILTHSNPRNEEILQELHRALAIAEEQGLTAERANILHRIGTTHYYRDQYDEALPLLESARKLTDDLQDRLRSSDITHNIGMIHHERREYEKARECYEAKLATGRVLGDSIGAANAMLNLGRLYADSGQMERAAEMYSRSEQAYRDLGLRQRLSQALGCLGLMHCHLEEFDRAQEYFAEQDRIAEEIGDHASAANAHLHLGIMFSKMGDLDRSIESLTVAEEISRRIGNDRVLRLSLQNLAVAFIHTGEFDRALTLFRDVENLVSSSESEEGLFTTGNIGDLYFAMGRFEEALAHLFRALDGHREINYQLPVPYWLHSIAQTLVEICMSGRVMPAYLLQYLPTATPSTWRVDALIEAQRLVAEGTASARTLSNSEMIRNNHRAALIIECLLAEATADPERAGTALADLEQQISDASTSADEADLHYWIWRTTGRAEHGEKGLELYRDLAGRSRMHIYRVRRDELSAGLATVPDLSDVAPA